MITECIREGFRMANRNVQLVLFRMVAELLLMAGLLLFIGLPLLASALYLGFDLSHLKEAMLDAPDLPSKLLTRYMTILVMAAISLCMFLLFASVVLLYALGGTLGVLRNAAISTSGKFAASVFFREGKKNLSRLWRLTMTEGVLALPLIISLVIAAIRFIDLSGNGSMMLVFLHSFMNLLVAALLAVTVAVLFMFMMASLPVSVTEEGGVAETLNRTARFLMKDTRTVLFLLVLSMVFVAMHSGFLLIRAVPYLFPFIFAGSMFLSVMMVAARNYLEIFIWSVIIVYYMRTAGRAWTGGYEI